MADNQGGSQDHSPQKRVVGERNQALWNCRSITGKVPFLLDYLRNHSRVDVLMLQARALPQLDG